MKKERLIIKKKKKEKGKKRRYNSQREIVYESKSIWISLQKHDKMVKGISSGISIPVESPTIMKNMSF